jgi:hypothetical protein
MPRWPDPKKTPPTPVIATKPGRDEVWGLEIGAGAWTQDGRLGIVSGRYRTNVSLRFDGLRVAENFAVADVVADAAVAAPSARPPPLARQTPTASAAAPSQRKRRRSETVETTKANKKPTVAPARQQALAGEMLPPPPRQSLRGRVRQQPSPRPKRSRQHKQKQTGRSQERCQEKDDRGEEPLDPPTAVQSNQASEPNGTGGTKRGDFFESNREGRSNHGDDAATVRAIPYHAAITSS